MNIALEPMFVDLATAAAPRNALPTAVGALRRAYGGRTLARIRLAADGYLGRE